jgi:hypothetical protein
MALQEPNMSTMPVWISSESSRRFTREARRAVLDAMPFLRTAKRVSVVEVCSRDENEMR